VNDDPELLDLMLRDADDQEGIYRPGPYWRAYADRIAKALDREGISSFRSSPAIGTGYCDVFPADPLVTLAGIKRRLYLAARALHVHRRYDRAWRRGRHTRQEKRNRRLGVALGPWMRGFRSRVDLPDTTAGSPDQRVSFAGQEFGELYLRDFAWVSDYGAAVDFPAVRSVFEIGGGFGSMAHTLMHLFPNIRKYLYLDIPPVLYVGTQYLKHFHGDAVLDYRETRDRASITFSDTDEREIVAIAPWQIERVQASADLFWNSSSFQEMTRAIVSNYARHIDRLMAPHSVMGLYLYSARPSAHRLSASELQGIIEENTSFRMHPISAPIAPQIVAGSAWVGRR
jgi:putative sugar O-methyltransferase